jgi:hypothetical protein
MVSAGQRSFSSRSWWLVGAAAVAACLALAPRVEGSRKPTREEFQTLAAALSRTENVAIKPQSVSISTAAPGWAAVGWGDKPYNFLAFHRTGDRWLVVPSLIQAGQPFDGLCAFMPTVVVTDLFRIHCPPLLALHARPASSKVRAALRASLLDDPTIKQSDAGDPSRVRVLNSCVSRLDESWAAVAVAFPDTGLVAWFHGSDSHWRVFLSWHRALPPRDVILSLASCVKYNAASYGA